MRDASASFHVPRKIHPRKIIWYHKLRDISISYKFSRGHIISADLKINSTTTRYRCHPRAFVHAMLPRATRDGALRQGELLHYRKIAPFSFSLQSSFKLKVSFLLPSSYSYNIFKPYSTTCKIQSPQNTTTVPATRDRTSLGE